MPTNNTSNTHTAIFSNSAADIIKRLKDTANKDELVEKEIKRIRQKQVKAKLGRKKAIDIKSAKLIHSLSVVPEEAKGKPNYVPPGANIQEKNSIVIRSNMQRISGSQEKRKVTVSLSSEDLEQLRAAFPDLIDIPAAAFEKLAYDLRPEQESTRFNSLPFLTECKEGSKSKCLSVLGIETSDITMPPGNGVSSGSSGVSTDPAVPVSKDGILKKINELLDHLSSPEFSPELKIEQRAKQQDIQSHVDGFGLSGGPADQTAFYDFFNLQIAFEHVWQEVFDENVIGLIKDIYELIIERGVPQEDAASYATLNDFIQYAKTVIQTTEVPHPSILEHFDLNPVVWQGLYDEHKTELLKLASHLTSLQEPGTSGNSSYIDLLKKNGQKIIENAGVIHVPTRSGITSGNGQRTPGILMSLQNMLLENYAFTVFAANRQYRSINFGILLNYRQKWEPLGYQAGELISTMPLAPGEVRKFSKKIATKQSISQKESSTTSVKRSSESSSTVRAEAEIVQKALTKTNFTYANKTDMHVSLEGVGTIGGDVSYSFTKDTQTDSADTRKDFREAIVKSAEEYRNDHVVEITSSHSVDFEATENGEISNPNNELTVTYLFFELQRRFRVNEMLYRITPVVLVAQEMPRPDEINEAWVIAHDWIIRRAIMDETFVPALNYLSTKVVGDAALLHEQKIHLDNQRKLVKEIKSEFLSFQRLMEGRYTALEDAIEKRAAASGGGSGGLFGGVMNFVLGSGDSAERTRILEEAAQDAYNRAVQDEKESRSRLERELSVLQSVTDNYTKALSEHLNRETQIKRLLVHIKQNIFHYMQAIWLNEPADERFFRLHQVQVPDLTGRKKYSFTGVTELGFYPEWGTPRYVFEVSCELDVNFHYKSLVEVADLDNLIGFKGNYMLFPLKQSNELTDYMTAPYLNKFSGIADPDPAADLTLQDYFNYVCCLKKKMDKGELVSEEFEKYKPALLALYKKLITNPLRQNDEIIIPTGSLFIEALPGVHPVLENFKLMHRAVDVKKVQAEVRNAELENLRGATRLVEDQLDDPSIEKKIVIEGTKNVNVDADGE